MCVLITAKAIVMKKQTNGGIDTYVNVCVVFNPWIAILVIHGARTRARAYLMKHSVDSNAAFAGRI